MALSPAETEPKFATAGVKVAVGVGVAAGLDPDSVATVGVVGSLLATETVAVNVWLAAVGVKTTVRLQLALTARVVPQPLVSENEVAPTPPSVTDEMVAAPVPLFFTTSVCAALEEPKDVVGKVVAVGETEIVG